jgi:hypothetical protein
MAACRITFGGLVHYSVKKPVSMIVLSIGLFTDILVRVKGDFLRAGMQSFRFLLHFSLFVQGKSQQDHDVMRHDKRIPENDHTKYKDPGPGYHPIRNDCHPCDKGDNAPFEEEMKQGHRDKRYHHRVHLETLAGKYQRCREHIKKTERKQHKRGNPGRSIHILPEDPGQSIGYCRFLVFFSGYNPSSLLKKNCFPGIPSRILKKIPGKTQFPDRQSFKAFPERV